MSSRDDRLLGAFARIFDRPGVTELADAFVTNQLWQVQLNLSALGLATVPRGDQLEVLDLAGLAERFVERELTLWGVSATYNTAHPDEERRRDETRAAAGFISRLGASGAVAATLCSGSRNPVDMWGRHPGTQAEDAWYDFRESLEQLLPAAEGAGVLLAVEPEPANVVADLSRARRLVAELGADADRVGFVLDPANLVADVHPRDRADTLRAAFAELGDRTICVHAKDTVPWGETLRTGGEVDYALVAELYAELPHDVPFVIQDATESELPAVRELLRSRVLGVAV